MRTVALLASITGLYASVYFTLIYYGILRPDSALIPKFCRLEGSGCKRLLDHRDARLFVAPNSLVGSVFYAVVIAVLVSAPEVVAWIRYAAWLAVVVSLYLVYSLFCIVRTPCAVCLIAHSMNIIIALSLSI